MLHTNLSNGLVSILNSLFFNEIPYDNRNGSNYSLSFDATKPINL